LTAKAVAAQWNLPLLKLDVGRIFGSLVGQSEENIRRAIKVAESVAPCVLWADEIEKGFAQSDGSGDGALSKRLLGSMLNWLQDKDQRIFVVATANNILSLPPELQRKGRFDEIFFVDLPDDKGRREIIEIQMKLRNLNPNTFDMQKLVAAFGGFSGAEIEQAIVSTILQALHAKVDLSTDLFVRESKLTVPLSVSRREDVDALRQMAKGRFVPVM
jgi:SpoVK/Ycf46/Vps4 family AAA+-type ATPase